MVRVSDDTYSWVESASSNTDIGDGWFDDNLGHYWNPATQGWQDTGPSSAWGTEAGAPGNEFPSYAPPDYGGVQGPVDPYDYDVRARTPWAIPDSGEFEGPVDYTSDSPGAWNAQPNWWEQPEESYSLSLDTPSGFDFSNRNDFEYPQDRLDAEQRRRDEEQNDRPWWQKGIDFVQEGLGRDAEALKADVSTEGGFLNTVFGAGEANRRGIFGEGSDEWNPILREFVQAVVDPLTFGGLAVGGAIKGGGILGRAARGVLAPSFETGGMASTIGAEIGVNAAANFGGRWGAGEVAERTDNPWLVGAAGLAGGVIGGGGVLAGAKGIDALANSNLTKTIDWSSEQGSLHLPGRTPKVDVPDPAYIGNEMRLPAYLAPDATGKDVMDVARDGARIANSTAMVIDAQADTLWRQLASDVYQGADGNHYLRGVGPSAADFRRGIEEAPLLRVLERPGEYQLPPATRKIIDDLAAIAERSTAERDIFGIPVNRLSLEDEERFFARQLKELPGGEKPGAKRGGIGARLSAPKDAHRQFDDVGDAIAAGYVYEHPQAAMSSATARNLDKALNHHVKTLLDPLGQTAADRIDPAIQGHWQGLVKNVASVEGRLKTAERRTGLAEKQAKEYRKPLATLSRATNAEEVRAALKSARSELKESQADAIGWAKTKGGATVSAQNAQRQLDNLIKRAETIDGQLAAAEAQYPDPRSTIKVDYAGRVWTDTKKVAEQAAAIQNQIDQLVAKGLKLPVGAAASDVVDTGVMRDMANIRLQGANQGVIRAEKDAIAAARELIPQDATSAIRQMQNRLNALSKRGGQWASVADSLRAELATARDAVDDFKPNWENHRAKAARPTEGRRTVDQKLAPHLIGTDFDKQTAARIEAYYGHGIRLGDRVLNTNIPGVRQMNAFVTPMNSIGDFSVTLNQLAVAGVSHPKTFAKNFALAIKDMFDDAGYLKWEAQNADDAAGHGIILMGGPVKNTDFEFGSFIERIPVLGETQKHFQRFSNRMRVDMYNDATEAAAGAGRAMTDGEKTDFARAMNRITGVANSRATDAEGLLQFAPNFLRAHIENIAFAFTKGGIEGAQARRMLGTWAGAGMATSVGVALAQGRDWREVSKPFQVDGKPSWTPDGGSLRMNPNFATIRWQGNDTSVFGSYDSLARLAIISADAINQSIRQKDAMQLFDAVGYFASTKGSPLVKLFTDLIKGETFTGADPLDPLELAKRPLPFTAQNAIQGVQDGLSLGAIAKDTAIGAFGAKSNPMTITEELNALAPNGDFYSLSKEDQAAIELANPGVARRKETREANQEKRDQRTLSQDNVAKAVDNETFRVLDSIDLRKNDKFDAATAEYEEKSLFAVGDKEQRAAGKQLRDNVSQAQADAAKEKAGALLLNPDLFEQSQRDPAKRAVSEYYATYDQASKRGELNFDEQQTLLRALEVKYASSPVELKAIHDEINRTRTSDNPVINQLFKDQKALRDSGYWDAENKTAFRKENPGIAAIVQKYGYSPVSMGIEDVSTDILTRQLALDAQVAAKTLTHSDWIDARGDLQLEKRSRIDGVLSLYPEMKPGDLKSGSPVDRYFALVDSFQDPVTKKLGREQWAQVAAYLANQSPEDQKTIDNALGLNKTPMEKQYRDDMKAIDNSGYWTLRDRIWTAYAKSIGLPEGLTEQDLRGQLMTYSRKSMEDQLDRTKPNWRDLDPTAGETLAGAAVDKVFVKYNSVLTDVKKGFRQLPENIHTIAPLLAKWDFGGTGVEETLIRLK